MYLSDQERLGYIGALVDRYEKAHVAFGRLTVRGSLTPVRMQVATMSNTQFWWHN